MSFESTLFFKEIAFQDLTCSQKAVCGQFLSQKKHVSEIQFAKIVLGYIKQRLINALKFVAK